MDNLDKDMLPASNDSSKSAYEGDMERKLKELGKNIDTFMEKADASKKQSLAALQLKREETEAQLQTLKGASKEAWEELRTGTDRAFDDLQSAWAELKHASEKAFSKFQSNSAQTQSK